MADRVRTRPNPKWIRGTIGGSTVVDSRDVLFVWEVPYYPAWYVPLGDVRGTLVANGETFRSPSRGEGTRYDLDVDGRIIADAAWRHLDSPVDALRDRVRLEWEAMDAWFEEDVEVFVHPRSPEVRVDVLASSKRYRTPLPESGAVAGLVCFYNEKVDIELDGVRLDRPRTKFSYARDRHVASALCDAWVWQG